VRPLLLIPLLAACTPDTQQGPCVGPRAPLDPFTVTVPPFVQAHRNHIRLRLETREVVEVPVGALRAGEACARVTTPEATRQDRSWAHPPDPAADLAHPDLAGEHVRHEESWLELTPGQPVTFEVLTGPETTWTGTVAPPPARGGGARVVFVGSPAPPVQADVFARAAEEAPDLAFLTGDVQDTDDPSSTWAGLMHDLVPLTATALLHVAPGDRDDQEADGASEDEELFERLFGGQGRPGARGGATSVDVGGVRFVVLDTRDDRLGEAGSLQRDYLEEEARAAALSDDLSQVVVVLHQGPYSLAEQRPAYPLREALHDDLLELGVRLVVSGHGQLYERFEVDGIAYVSDGAGGGTLSDPAFRDEPEVPALRQAVSATHGFTRLDIAPDGGLTLTRLDVDGAVVDELILPAPAAE
jgi:hypothetical protein